MNWRGAKRQIQVELLRKQQFKKVVPPVLALITSLAFHQIANADPNTTSYSSATQTGIGSMVSTSSPPANSTVSTNASNLLKVGIQKKPGAPADPAAQLVANAHKLHIDRWQDKTKVSRAVVVAVHGTTQHAGSFQTLAEQLAAQGFIFIGLDLRGHGERFYKAVPGQPNRRVDYDKSADDLGCLLKKVHATYPKLPVFCIGESVGAGVATLCAGRYKGLMDGLILCSPGTRPRVFNPMMVLPDFVKGVTHLDSPMDVSKYIDEYSSDDKRVSDEMIADPLSRIKLTPKEILRTAFFIRTTSKTAKDVAPEVPVLIVQGEEDGIVSKKSTRQILKNLPSEHKELVEFTEAGHVLLGTSYLKPQVFNSVSKWLSDQTELARPKVIGLHESPKESIPQ